MTAPLFRGAAFAVLLLTATSAIAADTNPTAVQAGRYAVETAHTRGQFSVSHMGFSNWYGDFTGVTAPPASGSQISVQVTHTGVATTTELPEDLTVTNGADISCE